MKPTLHLTILPVACHEPRKNHVVPVKMSGILKIGMLGIYYALVGLISTAVAQDDSLALHTRAFEMEAVEVIGQRSPAVLSEISRTVTVVGREDIENSGIQNVIDLIEFGSNADIRQRGIYGIQADASIRGGSFDHVMVLINGINVSDPQSGHLSLDIPVNHESVERVEVLEGPAARVYGPGAFTGVLNFVTKNAEKNTISASQVLGKYGYSRTQLSAGFKIRLLQNSISASHSVSDGYMENTDHRLQNLYYRGTLQKAGSVVDFQAGFQHKKFGAGGFYSPRFPDQYEEASVWLASLKVSTGTTIRITPSVYWRRRKDHYLLVRDNPSFYENFHRTDVYGSQINISYTRKIFTTTIGVDLRSENILSNNIGFEYAEPVAVKGEDSAYYTRRYGRTNMAVFAEGSLVTRKLKISAGLMVNGNTAYPDKPMVFPGADISYLVLPGMHVYASINRALHLPTFTDLSYTDPVNQGNINLNPDRMVSYEAGIKYRKERIAGQLTGFIQSGNDIIDWLWSYAYNRFTPVNLEDYRSFGLTAGISSEIADVPFLGKWIKDLTVNYLYMNIEKSVSDSVSKYYNLRNKLSVGISHHFTRSLVLSWKVSYQDRYGETVNYNAEEGTYYTTSYRPYWLLDGALTWKFRFLHVFVEVTNVLNTRYIDAGSVIQPGIWPRAGLEVRL